MNPSPITVHSFDLLGFGYELGASNPGGLTLRQGGAAGISWPSAGLGYICPFRIEYPTRFLKGLLPVAAAANNASMGIYSKDLKLITSGSAPITASANTVQGIDFSDELLSPDLYYMAVSVDGVSFSSYGLNITPAAFTRFYSVFGVAQMASAWPLPDTFVPADISFSFFPFFGLTTRSLV